ncbi:putative membrane protein YccC [Bradyrhizobium sp. USDA 4503]
MHKAGRDRDFSPHYSALLLGLRLWASTCLALYIAFQLELESPYWAATSAAIACLPQLGASLQKGWFRMIGTITGAVATVLMAASLPQDRIVLLTALSLWGAACALAATLLRNYTAYAAALAGYTMAIIAGEQLRAIGSLDAGIFLISVDRVAEICIGVACTAVVFAGTDLRPARRQLASLFSRLTGELSKSLVEAVQTVRPSTADNDLAASRLLREVTALDALIDTSIAADAVVRHHSRELRSAADSLRTAILDCWTLTNLISRSRCRRAQMEISVILGCLPSAISESAGSGRRLDHAIAVHQRCRGSIERLAALNADTPSLRLLADKSAEVLAGIASAIEARALLSGFPRNSSSRAHRIASPTLDDWTAALINGTRALLAIGVVAALWIATAWPSGATAVTWATITVVLMSTRGEQAYSGALGIVGGNFLSVSCAAVLLFAIFPHIESFAGLSLAVGVYLVPIGALMARPRGAALVSPMVGHFFAFLQPVNLTSYDAASFFNSAVAIVGGCGLAAVAFRIIPSASPARRTRRLVPRALKDLRALAAASRLERRDGHVPRSLRSMPEQATAVQRAQVLAVLAVGKEIIHLRHSAGWLGLAAGLTPALANIAQGDGVAATAQLARLDATISAGTSTGLRQTALRARSSILIISQALSRQADCFGPARS